MISLAGMTMSQAERLVRSGELDLAELLPVMTAQDQFGALTWVSDSLPGPSTKPEHPLGLFPAVLKANICQTNWPTDCGSRILARYRSPFAATVVRRLENAGARFFGTTAMDEFGMGSSCEYCASGPVTNPWQSGRTAGGSSGGSAAAVAGGLAWYALGTDTGGSVRLPAHCCGLVGFKPTWGRVSRFGLVPFASSLDTIGVLARSVSDAALVLQHMAGHDPLDATCLDDPVADLVTAAQRPARGMIVGVPRRLLERDHHPDLVRDFEECLLDLAGLGIRVTDIELPTAAEAVAIYQILACAEAASNLARYDGSLYGVRCPGGSYQETGKLTRTAGLGPEVKRRIMWGTHVLSEGYRHRLYLKARSLRQLLAREFAGVFTDVDAVALPTSPSTAFKLGSLVADPVAMHEVDVYTVPASLAGLPAVTLPTGVDTAGLPLSLQLVGPALGEPALVTLAANLEAHRSFRDRKEAPWHRS